LSFELIDRSMSSKLNHLLPIARITGIKKNKRTQSLHNGNFIYELYVYDMKLPPLNTARYHVHDAAYTHHPLDALDDLYLC